MDQVVGVTKGSGGKTDSSCRASSFLSCLRRIDNDSIEMPSVGGK